MDKDVKVEIDRSVNAGYITLTGSKIERTLEIVPSTVLIDVDADGKLVGIEFLDVAKDISEEKLQTIFQKSFKPVKPKSLNAPLFYRNMWVGLVIFALFVGAMFGLSLAGIGLSQPAALFAFLATIGYAVTLSVAGRPDRKKVKKDNKA